MLTGHYVGSWDVSSVETVEDMFRADFNYDIEEWVSVFNNGCAPAADSCPLIWTSNGLESGTSTTGNVVVFTTMFLGTPFNQRVGHWDTSGAFVMVGMFLASDFNQPIGSWDVSFVMSFNEMFQDATAFNQDISGWDVEFAQNMSKMFKGVVAFDQDLTSWCVSPFLDVEPDQFDDGEVTWDGLPANVADGSGRAAGHSNWGRPLWGSSC